MLTYLVLARKYRPQNLDELIGQEYIADLLKKTIVSDKIAHAYLFCGPRGVGKTSCARILAKSLNCQEGPTLKPCGKCPACQEITGGNSFDVLEIDGASNRGIDEIRALRENVKFAPSYGRFKIYIVDEVHMLTTEAFNALLKTLEEPPAHVKFIFATTAVHKVPATILSRCHRFDFKRIPLSKIVETLQAISQKENLKIEEAALFTIAKAAEGSLRDALSILDQLSALSEKNILSQDVFSMLGIVETEFLFELVNGLMKKDCAHVLEVLEKIIDKGKDIQQLVKDLIEHFRHLMVMKIGGKNLGKLVEGPIQMKEDILAQSERLSLKEILKAIDTLIEVQETARVTESIRIPLEVAFAQLTFQDEERPPSAAIVSSPQARSFPPANVLKNERGEVNIEKDPLDLEKLRTQWDALTYALSRVKMSIATYLQEGFPYEWKAPQLVIGMPKHCAFQKENLETENNIKLVEKVFSEKLKTQIIITYQLVEEHKPAEEEPHIKSALDAFKGKVVSRWHNS